MTDVEKDAEAVADVRLDDGAATQRLRQVEEGAVVSRRGVMWRAGIATVVGAVALTGLDEQRAQAASGGNFLLGSFNDAGGTTQLKPSANVTMGFSRLMFLDGSPNVTQSTLDVTAPADVTAINGHVTGAGKAVTGTSGSGVGVAGTSTSGSGVTGASTSGTGVAGTSSGGNPGVSGNSTSNGTGVVGTSALGWGVNGVAFADGKIGVRGAESSPNGGVGVLGVSNNGIAVSASSATGGAVQADAQLFHLRLYNTQVRNSPVADAVAHLKGDMVETTSGDLWLCTVSGTPGTWRKLGGPAAAGAFHLLPVPVRIYDSRPGTPPAVNPKTPLSGNVARVLDTKANSSGVPTGATGVMVTLLLVNAAQVNGNVTLWTNGASRPASNTMVWGPGSGRYTTTAVTAVDASAKLQIAASQSTDVVIDVVGYYQ